jgi:hypothetical protein
MFNQTISIQESGNNYNPKDNPGSSATGKYQHIWSIHGEPASGQAQSEIEKITGVKTREEYLKNPEAQEKYQNYLGDKYKKTIANFKDNYKLNTPDETLMALTHYLGAGDANVYLKTLSETKDYDKAQSAVDASIRSRSKGGILPKNKNVQEYLDIFNKKLKVIREGGS